MDDTTEHWKPAPRWESVYEVSDHGRIRRVSTGRILQGFANARGYRQMNLRDHGRRECPLAHRLIACAFLGSAPSDRHEINHADGDKANNRVKNLEWVTPSQNQQHAYAIGLKSSVGEANGRAKLTEVDVRAIREDTAPGVELARRYDVTPTLVSLIRKRKVWTRV